MRLSNAIRSFVHPACSRVLSAVVLVSCLSASDVCANGSVAFAFGSKSIGASGGTVPLNLTFQGSVGLAGLQLTIVSTSDAARFNNIERGERVIDARAWGFDYSISRGGDTLRAVLWSRNGQSLTKATYNGLLNINVGAYSKEPCSLILKDVQSVLADGQGSTAHIVIGSPASVDISLEEKMPAHLSQNFPNPCNPSTLIRYVVPEEGHVTLRVYNALGEEVRTMVDGVLPAGEFQTMFSMEGLPSGMYIYRFSGPGFEDVRKMMLLK